MVERCPVCQSVHVYQDRDLWVCPECAHEFADSAASETAVELVCRDANGQTLNDGDTVVLIKDLKVKGGSGTLKSGTKVKGIRVIEPEAGHNISCRIEGFGAMNLKSEFVKKV